jgi:hypothetical protein
MGWWSEAVSRGGSGCGDCEYYGRVLGAVWIKTLGLAVLEKSSGRSNQEFSNFFSRLFFEDIRIPGFFLEAGTLGSDFL